MKLVVVAALITVCAAGRLENLERSYLPPDNSIISGKHRSNSRGFGSSFDVGSSFGQHQGHPQNSFPSASNRYLPPTKGASNDATQFIGTVKGFSGSHSTTTPYQQYSIPSMSYGTPQASTGMSQSQFGASSRQYIAPNANSKQNLQLRAPTRQYLTPNAGSSQNGNQQLGSSSGSQFGAANNRGQSQQFGSATSRQYLTPHAGGSQSNSHQQFSGSSAGQQQRFGASLSQQYSTPQANRFPSTGNKQLGASNNIQQQQFGAASSRQYLAPHLSGSLGSGNKKIGGSSFGQQQFKSSSSQYFAPDAEQFSSSQKEASQFGPASHQLYLAPHISGSQKSVSSHFETMFGSEGLGGSSRQYLAPRVSAFQGVPQQAFNERTGYQY